MNHAKRKKGMARLMELAMRKRVLVISSCVLAVISTAVSFTPFIAIYYIIRELVTHYADLSTLNTAYLIQMGRQHGEGGVVTINKKTERPAPPR
ncbi:hypothetical protein R80B4_03274 [Fibrobacteres bacterium R8-0-B4]